MGKIKKKTLGKRQLLNCLRESARQMREKRKNSYIESKLEFENELTKIKDASARRRSPVAAVAAASTSYLEEQNSVEPPLRHYNFEDRMDAQSDLVSSKDISSNTGAKSQLDFQKFSEDDERRIVDLKYFIEQLKLISNHSRAFGCGINNILLTGEKRIGLESKLNFKCNMCNLVLSINTTNHSPTANLNLNIGVVSSAVTVGVGYTQLQEIFSSINVPFMTEALYKKLDDNVGDEWAKVATAEMEAAAAREKQCALDEGRVNENKIPIIDVIADGCWAKRTYKKNYSSLSGAAAIIGRKFGEVLYLGVKNKYCCICARAKNCGTAPKDHKCFKNYEGSSTNMESEILVEGFKQSLDMYGIIYGRMIADGDASTYSKILESRPYPNYTVEKIECRNHLLRNLCNRLHALITDTKYNIQERKHLNTRRILAMRKVIVSSIKNLKETNQPHWKKINELFTAITNSYNHAFSNHAVCQNYYCNSESKSEDITVKLRNTQLEKQIKLIIGYTAANSRSLIEDVDSNRCEQFNAIIAKSIGGKRINFCQRRSYQTRCAAAVVSFNSKRPLYKLQKFMLGLSPKSKSKRLEMKKLKKNSSRSKVKRKQLNLSTRHQNDSTMTNDKDYGQNCIKPDLPVEDLDKLKKTFLNNLVMTDEEIIQVERETVLQAECSKWKEMRRNLITASNFGRIMNKKPTTSASIVKSLLYKKDLAYVDSIRHGKINEKNAVVQIETQENIKIIPCGLFIDKKHPFLGASPDGLVDDDKIIEIKCPISAYKTSLEEAIKKRKITFWKFINGQLMVNTKHQWYWQVQGQLNIVNKNYCIFAVWTGSSRKIKTEIIKRDEELWNNIMVPKLKEFYWQSLLPELLDSRTARNMPLRDTDPRSTSSETKENRPETKKAAKQADIITTEMQKKYDYFTHQPSTTKVLHFKEF